MTVIGIAGCTALTTAGFGIKDSIQCVIDNQYEQILHYDNVITFKSDVESEEINNIISSIKKDEYYKEYTTDYGYTADVKALGGGDSYSTEITVVDNTDKYSDFVTFRTRKKHTLFKGLIFTDIVLPIVAYAMMLMYKYLSGRNH